MKIRYSHLWVGEKFTLDGQEWIKSNHDRAYHYKDGYQIFRNVKKAKIVEVNNEVSKHL